MHPGPNFTLKPPESEYQGKSWEKYILQERRVTGLHTWMSEPQVLFRRNPWVSLTSLPSWWPWASPFPFLSFSFLILNKGRQCKCSAPLLCFSLNGPFFPALQNFSDHWLKYLIFMYCPNDQGRDCVTKINHAGDTHSCIQCPERIMRIGWGWGGVVSTELLLKPQKNL